MILRNPSRICQAACSRPWGSSPPPGQVGQATSVRRLWADSGGEGEKRWKRNMSRTVRIQRGDDAKEEWLEIQISGIRQAHASRCCRRWSCFSTLAAMLWSLAGRDWEDDRNLSGCVNCGRIMPLPKIRFHKFSAVHSCANRNPAVKRCSETLPSLSLNCLWLRRIYMSKRLNSPCRRHVFERSRM